MKKRIKKDNKSGIWIACAIISTLIAILFGAYVALVKGLANAMDFGNWEFPMDEGLAPDDIKTLYDDDE